MNKSRFSIWLGIVLLSVFSFLPRALSDESSFIVTFLASQGEMLQFRDTQCALSFTRISKSKAALNSHIDWASLFDFSRDVPLHNVVVKLPRGKYRIMLRTPRLNLSDYVNAIPLRTIEINNDATIALDFPPLWTLSVNLEKRRDLDTTEHWQVSAIEKDSGYRTYFTLDWKHGELTGQWEDVIPSRQIEFTLFSSSGKSFLLEPHPIGKPELTKGSIRLRFSDKLPKRKP